MRGFRPSSTVELVLIYILLYILVFFSTMMTPFQPPRSRRLLKRIFSTKLTELMVSDLFVFCFVF